MATQPNTQFQDHPQYRDALKLEAMAKVIDRQSRSGRTRAATVARSGLTFLVLAAQMGAIDELNRISDIANGLDGGGCLSERTLDNLFEDECVTAELIPLLVHRMGEDAQFAQEIRRSFGADTIQRWHDETCGTLFSPSNVATETDRTNAYRATVTAANNARELVQQIPAAASLAFEF